MNRKVLLLGNPLLREKCSVVNDFNSEELKKEITDLKDTLEDFRKNNGFGRGIAAIQIGIMKRIIALNLGDKTFVVINPKIIEQSNETLTLWDDCMSFPNLLVRVNRNSRINLEYQDENGNLKEWRNLSNAESELLQHEIDHLDGILAVDRVIHPQDIIYRSEYEKNIKYYEDKVSYKIESTITNRK